LAVLSSIAVFSPRLLCGSVLVVGKVKVKVNVDLYRD